MSFRSVKLLSDRPVWFYLAKAMTGVALLFVAVVVAFSQPKTDAESPQRLVLLDVAARCRRPQRPACESPTSE